MGSYFTSLRNVSIDYFDHGTWNFHTDVILETSSEEVWKIFLTDELVTTWHPEISHVRWLTPKPYGIGTKRTVQLKHWLFSFVYFGAITLTEEFIVFEENKRVAFRIININRPNVIGFLAAAEDFQFQPIENGKTRFLRTVSVDPSLLVWLFGAIVKPIFHAMFTNAAKTLATKIANREYVDLKAK